MPTSIGLFSWSSGFHLQLLRLSSSWALVWKGNATGRMFLRKVLFTLRFVRSPSCIPWRMQNRPVMCMRLDCGR